MELDLTEEQQREVRNKLTKVFEEIFHEYWDTGKMRLFIVNYTMGYMGAVYGLHIPQEYDTESI
jgi:hypothetical protein